MKILLSGISGYMGREVVNYAKTGYRGAVLIGGIDRDATGEEGVPTAKGFREEDFTPEFVEAAKQADCIIDFTHHSCMSALLDFAVNYNIPVVLCTTGQTEEENAKIAEAAKEIYDKEITFSEKARADLKIITAAVDEILELAYLDRIKDKYRREYIQSIITKMYYSDFIKVNNARIPREQIIKQLSRITPDTIEFMMKKMLENTGSMSNEVGYAIACLYNAIDGIDIDVDVDIARDFGYRGCY